MENLGGICGWAFEVSSYNQQMAILYAIFFKWRLYRQSSYSRVDFVLLSVLSISLSLLELMDQSEKFHSGKSHRCPGEGVLVKPLDFRRC